MAGCKAWRREENFEYLVFFRHDNVCIMWCRWQTKLGRQCSPKLANLEYQWASCVWRYFNIFISTQQAPIPICGLLYTTTVFEVIYVNQLWFTLVGRSKGGTSVRCQPWHDNMIKWKRLLTRKDTDIDPFSGSQSAYFRNWEALLWISFNSGIAWPCGVLQTTNVRSFDIIFCSKETVKSWAQVKIELQNWWGKCGLLWAFKTLQIPTGKCPECLSVAHLYIQLQVCSSTRATVMGDIQSHSIFD